MHTTNKYNYEKLVATDTLQNLTVLINTTREFYLPSVALAVATIITSEATANFFGINNANCCARLLANNVTIKL